MGTAPGLGVIAACVAASFALHRAAPSVSPLATSVLLGALGANLGVLPEQARIGCRFASTRMLRLGVVLLGFRMGIGDALGLGARTLSIVMIVVAVTFFGTRLLGRLLDSGPGLSLLVATGYSICGASAIAAMQGVTDADEDDVGYAIALVTLCGSLAIVLLPVAREPLGLEGGPFGAWVGASVHDVGQVVAAASTAGSDALRMAVLVKLTRVVLLAPVVASVALGRRRRPTDPAAARPPLVPTFVVGFLASMLVRSSGLVPVEALSGIRTAETLLLAAGLVGLGAGIDVRRLRTLGGRPLALGFSAWMVVASSSLLLVLSVDLD